MGVVTQIRLYGLKDDFITLVLQVLEVLMYVYSVHYPGVSLYGQYNNGLLVETELEVGR